MPPTGVQTGSAPVLPRNREKRCPRRRNAFRCPHACTNRFAHHGKKLIGTTGSRAPCFNLGRCLVGVKRADGAQDDVDKIVGDRIVEKFVYRKTRSPRFRWHYPDQLGGSDDFRATISAPTSRVPLNKEMPSIRILVTASSDLKRFKWDGILILAERPYMRQSDIKRRTMPSGRPLCLRSRKHREDNPPQHPAAALNNRGGRGSRSVA